MKGRSIKSICILLLLGVNCVITFSFVFFASFADIAYAEEEYNSEVDAIFVKNVAKLAKENYFGNIVLISTKDNLYDINLESLGYIFDFTVNNEPGYAIAINHNGIYNITEVFFNAINPYKGLTDIKKIYLKEFNYLYYCDDEYYFAETDIPVTDEIWTRILQKSYYSSTYNTEDSVITNETIYYIEKTENSYELAKRYPGLVQISAYSNACAPIAGANLVQYWDKYKANLIADYTPGTSLGNYYLYYEPSDTTDAVIGQLYSDMGTNTIENGTSIPQFLAGMSIYCNRAGYSFTYNSCMQNGQFSFTLAKQRIDAGEPLVLFVEDLSVAKIFALDGNDLIDYALHYGSHVIAGFGYKAIEYTLNDGTTLTNYYIAVASGIITKSRGYYNIAYNTVIDDAYGISII